MKIVLDTNVLLQSIARASRFRPIWNCFLTELFQLYVTSPILLEYEEKVAEKTSENVADNIILLIREAPNAHFINVYYQWNAITADYDDNKFFDAAVSANVDYLVSNDSHFYSAKKLRFPKVTVITAEEFLDIISAISH